MIKIHPLVKKIVEEGGYNSTYACAEVVTKWLTEKAKEIDKFYFPSGGTGIVGLKKILCLEDSEEKEEEKECASCKELKEILKKWMGNIN